MPTVSGHEIDGPTAWRLAVLALVVGGFVVAYRSTGSVAESLVLGVLGAIAAAVALVVVSTLSRALQRAFR